MKKYFLLIAPLAVILLWLGNYTHAEDCHDGSTCTSPLICDCSQPDIDQWDTGRLCNACKNTTDTNSNVIGDSSTKQDCEVLWGLWMSNGQWWNACCDTACQTCKAKAWSVVKYDTSLKNMVCSDTGQQALESNLCAGWLLGDGPKGWVINSFGVCSCPDWTKNIDGVCKPCSDSGVCCGISLNTNVPFIGNCIESSSTDKGTDETNVTWETAFPVLMWSLTKILVTVILILSFVLIVVWGIMIATGDPSWGKKMIMKVVVGIAILGASGVILRLINPNFFG